ncbi:hypothetical protein SKAU_G00402930 [Synaphobranchus kaupii]|uniref:Uncharacterized protein n=1 Tax=Synaphobranchus kaupii TaxID=118154 RepID=A0A9Q1E9D9_SYNKA|nr:hypothetical protein SKAU_G00402930 [Synaphobranchus kaupii]
MKANGDSATQMGIAQSQLIRFLLGVVGNQRAAQAKCLSGQPFEAPGEIPDLSEDRIGLIDCDGREA